LILSLECICADVKLTTIITKNTREIVIIMWHEKWTVGDVSCGDYDELREGVRDGEQERQGPDYR